MTLFLQLRGLIFDLSEGFADVLQQFLHWGFLLEGCTLLHDVRNLLHVAVELQCDTNSLRHIIRILNAHANKLCNLIEFLLVALVDWLVTFLVDELNDTVGYSVVVIAVDRANHEVPHVSYFGLIVDFIDETWLFFSIVAHDEITGGENYTRKTDICWEVNELDSLLVVKDLQPLCCF